MCKLSQEFSSFGQLLGLVHLEGKTFSVEHGEGAFHRLDSCSVVSKPSYKRVLILKIKLFVSRVLKLFVTMASSFCEQRL